MFAILMLALLALAVIAAFLLLRRLEPPKPNYSETGRLPPEEVERTYQRGKAGLRLVSNLVGGIGGLLWLAILIWTSVEVVQPSNVGVVTVFGKIQEGELPAGLHFVGPIAQVHQVYTGVHVVGVPERDQQGKEVLMEAASKDLQSVHARLTVNYHPKVGEIQALYRMNVGLNYAMIIVPPATGEVFKAIVSRYTAEELITKRQEVSAAITAALNERLAQYHLAVQSTQLVNFGFSDAFDKAIEEKVTASQKAATAQRNLERIKFEAESRIAQARGEAEAIRIQAEAVSKAGGEDYVRLKAVEKWNGTLPTYVTAGAPMPFVGVGK